MNYEEMQQAKVDAAEQKQKQLYRRIKIIAAVFFLLVVGVVLNPVVIVQPGYRGVVTHMGATQKVVLEEGLNFVMPIRDSVHQIYVGIKKTETDGESGTSDSQKVDVKVAINWHQLPNSTPYIYKELGNDAESRILMPAILDAMKGAVGKFRAEELIVQRDEARNKITERLRKIVNPHGIEIDETSITSLSFSKAFDKSIEEKIVAEQKKKQAEFDLARIEVEVRQELAKATGVAAQMKAKSKEITPDLLAQQKLDNERAAIDNQKDFIAKWDGKLSNVSGSGGMPFFMTLPSTGSGK
jgi:regulator of protease activity HflC (stomatin/prohibitin superfamily)